MMKNNNSVFRTLTAVIIFFSLSLPAADLKSPVISTQKVILRSLPNFLAKAIGNLPYGTAVEIIRKYGQWYLIKTADRKGWVHRSSVQEGYFILRDIGKGDAASGKTYKDEVVAAGKGFSPEYEALIKSENPQLNYELVDQIEKWQVGEDKLIIFATEGGLKSEILK